MTTWLVTGGSGFLGRHLLAALAAHFPQGVRVLALGRRLPSDWPPDDFARVDLDDAAALGRAVGDLAPDIVFHAAGLTPPAEPARLYRANTRATFQLLEALRASRRPVRVVLVGSAAELGPVAVEHLPVAEDHRCQPVDAYGLSKWAATTIGLAQGRPVEVVVARVFNPIGPGMPTTQALGRFAWQLSGTGPTPLPLVVGDLDARRDFIDVRDVAGALIALASQGHPGLVYHVGTGVSHRVGEGLEELVKLSGREVAIVRGHRGRRGPADSRADIGRIVAHTGWRPAIAWEQSLSDLWDEVRLRLVEAPAPRQVA